MSRLPLLLLLLLGPPAAAQTMARGLDRPADAAQPALKTMLLHSLNRHAHLADELESLDTSAGRTLAPHRVTPHSTRASARVTGLLYVPCTYCINVPIPKLLSA